MNHGPIARQTPGAQPAPEDRPTAGGSYADAPHWLNRTEYPFKSRWWETSAGRIHYVDEGHGKPVVFVHGVPAWSYNFRLAIRRLSGSHRCVAVDHLGFGLSDKPRLWSYEPALMAQHLEDLIHDLDLRDVTLVVHDWGGPLGLSYALRHRANVDRLVILNSWMWSSDGDWRAQIVARVLASRLYGFCDEHFAITPRWFTRLAVSRRKAILEDTFRHFERPLARREHRAGLRALVRAIRHSDSWVGSLWSQRDQLRDIPALVVWGMNDPAFPRKYLDRWRKLFNDATVRPLPNVGHYPHEEMPEMVTNLICAFVSRPLATPESEGRAD
jgi:haloalkane dehalogenase